VDRELPALTKVDLIRVVRTGADPTEADPTEAAWIWGASAWVEVDREREIPSLISGNRGDPKANPSLARPSQRRSNLQRTQIRSRIRIVKVFALRIPDRMVFD
jgi:hypothetical protein